MAPIGGEGIAPARRVGQSALEDEPLLVVDVLEVLEPDEPDEPDVLGESLDVALVDPELDVLDVLLDDEPPDLPPLRLSVL